MQHTVLDMRYLVYEEQSIAINHSGTGSLEDYLRVDGYPMTHNGGIILQVLRRSGGFGCTSGHQVGLYTHNITTCCTQVRCTVYHTWNTT